MEQHFAKSACSTVGIGNLHFAEHVKKYVNMFEKILGQVSGQYSSAKMGNRFQLNIYIYIIYIYIYGSFTSGWWDLTPSSLACEWVIVIMEIQNNCDWQWPSWDRILKTSSSVATFFRSNLLETNMNTWLGPSGYVRTMGTSFDSKNYG